MEQRERLDHHLYIPTAVERRAANQNRRHGVVFDDDGDGQVGRSQSAQDTVRGRRQRTCISQTPGRLSEIDEEVTRSKPRGSERSARPH